VELREIAEEMGYLGVLSGPLVRSSYRAGRLWAGSMLKKGREIPAELTHLAEQLASNTPAAQAY
jgi:lipoic acid synthetase